ncbi:hypothetical protein J416_04121 [Gracilibacillus halophilus YIM-C55.5]|uniref:Uncharacterized protein n=1 Tax=Gracilibacillus halophilus YIM-C55.5 TaxID=1308866 RepID=N4WNK6_9BACI|nr:CBO0543 family protein [Gracilibacillus halophilus]ENH97722.1 hypothetical protein J416_04121 [Gracilibacillus halophilus YIM-C55.5]
MSIEHIIIIMVWIVSFSVLFIFIPKDKILHALVASHIKQAITWVFGLIVSNYRLIEYPVRLFPYTSKASFTFEFFAYPAICAIFNVHYPEGRSRVAKFGYYALYSSIITIIEIILERNTDVINYIHWSWYWTWITLFISFFLSRSYYKWFFNRIYSHCGHTK